MVSQGEGAMGGHGDYLCYAAWNISQQMNLAIYYLRRWLH